MRHAEQIESENQIGIAGVHFGGRFDGLLAQQQMRDHRAALLRRAGLIERRDATSPSIQAAVASSALIVTTPVPPMPGPMMR